MRLDRFLVNLKYGTRKSVAKAIRDGLVSVNGETVRRKDAHIDPERDWVNLAGEDVVYFSSLTLMMNKRPGTVSSASDAEGPSVFGDLDIVFRRHDLHIAGRLDKDASGLLVLTAEGGLAHELTHPKKGVPKTYEIYTESRIDSLERLRHPVEILDGKNRPYWTDPAEVLEASGNRAVLRIREGKYHQVKQMMAAVNHRVSHLRRIAIGALELDSDLAEGEARTLTDDERQLLFEDPSSDEDRD